MLSISGLPAVEVFDLAILQTFEQVQTHAFILAPTSMKAHQEAEPVLNSDPHSHGPCQGLKEQGGQGSQTHLGIAVFRGNSAEKAANL